MLCERECASTGNGDVMRCCAKENAPTKANSGAYPTHVLRSSKSAWHRPCCSPSLSLCTLSVQLSHRAQSIPFTPAVRPPFTVHCQSSSLRNRAMFRSSPQHKSQWNCSSIESLSRAEWSLASGPSVTVPPLIPTVRHCANWCHVPVMSPSLEAQNTDTVPDT